MAQLYDWDISAANNNSAPPDGFPENMDYSEVNDAAREVMAVLARFLTSIKGTLTSTGTEPDYAVTSGLSFSSYAAGQLVAFTAHATSTGNVTLNVDGLGAADLLDARGNQLTTGDIQIDSTYLAVRRSSDFQLIGSIAAASAIALINDTFNIAYATGGSSNAYTVTSGFSLSSVPTNSLWCVVPDRNNTGAATLNIDSIGAVAWEDAESAALVADDIQSGVACVLHYNGTEFRTIAGIPINLATMVSGALPVANGGTAATSASGARTSLGVAYASASQIRSAASGVVLETAGIESASAAVALSDAATIALDWDTGINFTVTLGGNRALGAPTNGQPGTWRRLQVTQDGTGSRTLDFATATTYYAAGGTAPSLSSGAGDIDVFYLYCRTTSIFEVYSGGLDMLVIT